MASNAGHNAAQDALVLFVERIERLQEEKQGIADDIKDVFAEAKSTGYDPRTMREIIKRRKLTPEVRQERDALMETYLAAFGIE